DSMGLAGYVAMQAKHASCILHTTGDVEEAQSRFAFQRVPALMLSVDAVGHIERQPVEIVEHCQRMDIACLFDGGELASADVGRDLGACSGLGNSKDLKEPVIGKPDV